MNISAPKITNNSQYQTNKNNLKTNFKSNRTQDIKEIVELSAVAKEEVAEGLSKIISKIKFLNRILGQNDKTTKPVLAKIGDSFVFINMDKTTKGMTKISLYADTGMQEFQNLALKEQCKNIHSCASKRQSLDIVISDKDARMCRGDLISIQDDFITFERNPKTGKRRVGSGYLCLVPNVKECRDQKFEMNSFICGFDKTTLMIREIFYSLFSKLSLVKPGVTLTR